MQRLKQRTFHNYSQLSLPEEVTPRFFVVGKIVIRPFDIPLILFVAVHYILNMQTVAFLTIACSHAATAGTAHPDGE